MAVEGADPVRREKLIELLDIDLQWKMHKVSDGQRRRVQICMGLLHPFKVRLDYECVRFHFRHETVGYTQTRGISNKIQNHNHITFFFFFKF